MKNEKLIFIAPSNQSFIKNDIDILSKKFNVIVNQYNWKDKKLALLNFIKQFFFIAFNLRKVSYILVSFGGYWAFWPVFIGKIFSIKTFIILHGTDCASIPEIGYGSLRIPLLKKFCEYSYHSASMLLPVSSTLVYSQLSFDPKIKSTKQGLRFHFKSLKTPINVIPNGLNINDWGFSSLDQKDPETFISVFSKEQFILKSGDLIVQIAKKFKEFRFFIAGMDRPADLNTSQNLVFLGKLSQPDLAIWYQKCTFYFQLSIFEGFGLALAEAMLCGCIPIVSNIDHFENIIGESGFVLEKKTLSSFCSTWEGIRIDKDLNNRSIMARKHIADNFSIEKRGLQLYKVIEENR